MVSVTLLTAFFTVYSLGWRANLSLIDCARARFEGGAAVGNVGMLTQRGRKAQQESEADAGRANLGQIRPKSSPRSDRAGDEAKNAVRPR